MMTRRHTMPIAAAAAVVIICLSACPCRPDGPPKYTLVFHSIEEIAQHRDGDAGDLPDPVDAGAEADGSSAADAGACDSDPSTEPPDPSSGTTVHGTVVDIGTGCNPQGWLAGERRYRDQGCDYWVTIQDGCGEHFMLEGTDANSVAMINVGDVISVEHRADVSYSMSGSNAQRGEVTVHAADGTLLLFWLANDLQPTTTSGGIDVALGTEHCPSGCSYHYNLVVTYQGEQGEVPYVQSQQIGDMMFQHLGAFSLAGPECLMGDDLLLDIAGYRTGG